MISFNPHAKNDKDAAVVFLTAEQKQEHRDRYDCPAEGVTRQRANSRQNSHGQRQAEQPAGAWRRFARTPFDFKQKDRQSQENHQQQQR